MLGKWLVCGGVIMCVCVCLYDGNRMYVILEFSATVFYFIGKLCTVCATPIQFVCVCVCGCVCLRERIYMYAVPIHIEEYI